MQRTLWDPGARGHLIERLDRLSPDAVPLWGKMNAPQMVGHLISWMLMATGELTAAPRPGILRRAPVRYLAIYWLPFPKGVPTAKELLVRPPAEWSGERETLARLIENFETDHRDSEWPEHPAFGFLTPDAWGVLGYRHTHHHLTQFNV